MRNSLELVRASERALELASVLGSLVEARLEEWSVKIGPFFCKA